MNNEYLVNSIYRIYYISEPTVRGFLRCPKNLFEKIAVVTFKYTYTGDIRAIADKVCSRGLISGTGDGSRFP